MNTKNTKEKLEKTINTLKDEIQKHYEKIESLKTEKAQVEKEYSDIIYAERTAALRSMVGNYYELIDTYSGFGMSDILVSRYFYVKQLLTEGCLAIEKKEVWTKISNGDLEKTMYDKDVAVWSDGSYMDEDAKKQYGSTYFSNKMEFHKAKQIAQETFEMNLQTL